MLSRIPTTMSTHNNARLLPINSNAPQNDDSTAEFAKDFFVILLLGIVGMVCLVVIVYCLTRLLRWLSPQLFEDKDNDTLDDEPLPPLNWSSMATARAIEAAQRDVGTLTCKAHLWGMDVEERKSILHWFFQQRVRIMGQSDPEVVKARERLESLGDIEQGVSDGPINVPSTSVARPEDEAPSAMMVDKAIDVATDLKSLVLSDIEASPTTMVDNTSDEAKSDSALDPPEIQGMCCICLLHYEQGAVVMTGTQCGHLYHFDCCQAWLAQHDHCPYCRQEMLRPAEFRQAAVAVLGEARVNHLLTQHYQLAESENPLATQESGP